MSIKHISIWFPLLLVISILIQCNPKEEREIQNPTLKKILDAHGGLQQWDNQNTLQYTLGNQEQTIDLKLRNVKIEKWDHPEAIPDYSPGLAYLISIWVQAFIRHLMELNWMSGNDMIHSFVLLPNPK